MVDNDLADGCDGCVVDDSWLARRVVGEASACVDGADLADCAVADKLGNVGLVDGWVEVGVEVCVWLAVVPDGVLKTSVVAACGCWAGCHCICGCDNYSVCRFYRIGGCDLLDDIG